MGDRMARAAHGAVGQQTPRRALGQTPADSRRCRTINKRQRARVPCVLQVPSRGALPSRCPLRARVASYCPLPPGVFVEAHISPGRPAQLSPLVLCGQLGDSDANTECAGVRLRRAPGRVKGRGGAGVPGQGAHGCQGAAADGLVAVDEACRLMAVSGRAGLQREFELACRPPQGREAAVAAVAGGGRRRDSPGTWEEAGERTADERPGLNGGQKRWRAGASQSDGNDAGVVIREREGLRLGQDGRPRKRDKTDAEAPGSTGSREAHETGGVSQNVQLSGEECETYTMYSTLCPSDCGDEDLDGEEGRMTRGRMEEEGSQYSFDIFESFWSRVALVPTTAPEHASDAACARAVTEAEAAPLARGAGAEGNTCPGYPKTMDASAAREQALTTLPRLAPIVWERGVLPDEPEPQATAEHGPAHTLVAQEADRKAGRLTCFQPWAPSDGQTHGFEWVGDAALRKTATSWTWLLRENEEVMEALVLGQRVLRLLGADPGLFLVAARGCFRWACALRGACTNVGSAI